MNYQQYCTVTAQKMKLSIKDFFSKCDQILADLATFTEEILNEKLHFFCSALYVIHSLRDLQVFLYLGKWTKFVQN